MIITKCSHFDPILLSIIHKIIDRIFNFILACFCNRKTLGSFTRILIRGEEWWFWRWVCWVVLDEGLRCLLDHKVWVLDVLVHTLEGHLLFQKRWSSLDLSVCAFLLVDACCWIISCLVWILACCYNRNRSIKFQIRIHLWPWCRIKFRVNRKLSWWL